MWLVREWLNSEWNRLGQGKIGTGRTNEPFRKSKMPSKSLAVPQQNNGCDCGVFVCRYAYNMVVLMRNQHFTWSDIDAQITNSPEFQFGMRDIPRIRREIGELIDNLSLVYEGRPESPPDNDEFRVTAGVLTLFGDDESNTGQKQQQMNEDDMIEMNEDDIEEDFFSAFEDHGGKQATVKSPVSTRPKNSPRRKNSVGVCQWGDQRQWGKSIL